MLQHLRFANHALGSNLELWQLSPKKQIKLPGGINTKSWEWGGALSGDWLLFQRGEFDARAKSVRLFNLKTRQTRLLITAQRPHDRPRARRPERRLRDLHPCSKRCRTYRYQMSTRQTTPLRPPSGTSDYAPAVLADGTRYFVRSRSGCGKGVQVMRLDPGKTTPVPVATVSSGHDVQKLDATLYGGTRIVVYERYSCNFRITRRDLVRVVGAPAPPAP